jgi:S-(hydroxymethyl)glutathione dehydrogenase/alcohol dehydrogenase
VLGHEGAGVVEAIGDGVREVAVGDHVVTLFSPQCRECVHCLDPRTNLCLAIREQQGLGFLPDGTTRLSREGEPIRHFMGCSTFAEYTVMPEIALARVSREAPLDRACLFACGLESGAAIGSWLPARPAWSSAPVWSAGAVAGCRLQAERIVRPTSEERSSWPAAGRDRDLIGGLTRRMSARADRRLRGRLHLRGDRARGVMRQAVESARILGLATVCGVAGKGEVLRGRAALPDHGRRVAGCRWRRQGSRPGTAVTDRWLAVRSTSSRSVRAADARRGQPWLLMEAQTGSAA